MTTQQQQCYLHMNHHKPIYHPFAYHASNSKNKNDYSSKMSIFKLAPKTHTDASNKFFDLAQSSFNPITDEQHFDALQNITSLPLKFTSIFCLGRKTISQRAARRLMVLHPKQNKESVLKRQNCCNKVLLVVS